MTISELTLKSSVGIDEPVIRMTIKHRMSGCCATRACVATPPRPVWAGENGMSMAGTGYPIRR